MHSQSIADVVRECRNGTVQKMDKDELIVRLHDKGLTIAESIKAFRDVYDLPLGLAKELVTAHPLWSSTAKAADALHQELEDQSKPQG